MTSELIVAMEQSLKILQKEQEASPRTHCVYSVFLNTFGKGDIQIHTKWDRIREYVLENGLKIQPKVNVLDADSVHVTVAFGVVRLVAVMDREELMDLLHKHQVPDSAIAELSGAAIPAAEDLYMLAMNSGALL